MSTLPTPSVNGKHTLYDVARQYYDGDWPVVPAKVRRLPSGKLDKRIAGEWKALQEERIALDELEKRFRWTGVNGVGITLGTPCKGGWRLYRFDLEGPFPDKWQNLPPTLTFRTPSGGLGYIYRSKTLHFSHVLWTGKGDHEEVRFQGQGAFAVIPPTEGYEWVDSTVQIAELPAELEAELKAKDADYGLYECRRAKGAGPARDDILEALSKLPQEYRDEYDKWRNVLFALHEGGPQYCEHAIKWSMGSSKYEPGCVEVVWSWCDRQWDNPKRRIPLARVLEWAGGRKPPQQQQAGWKPTLIGARTLRGMHFKVDWLIHRVLAVQQPAVLGGVMKAAKTGLSTYLAICVATGHDFIGFRVPKPRKVLVFSGESGEAAIRSWVDRICVAIGADPADDMLSVCTSLPMLSSAKHVDELCAVCLAFGAELCIIDPLYMCLPGLDMRDAYTVGPALYELNRRLGEVGCTMLLVAHTTRAVPAGVLGIHNLAFTGPSQYAGQWMMVNRLDDFDEVDGKNELLLGIGGRNGQGSAWKLTLVEGALPVDVDAEDTRGFDLTWEYYKHKAKTKAEATAAAADETTALANRILDHLDNPARDNLVVVGEDGINQIVEHFTDVSDSQVREAIASLVKQELVAEVRLTVRKSNGATMGNVKGIRRTSCTVNALAAQLSELTEEERAAIMGGVKSSNNDENS